MGFQQKKIFPRKNFCLLPPRFSPSKPNPKNGHILPKNGLKMPILGKKKCFFGNWEVSSRPPNPILQVLDSKKHVLQHMEGRKWVFQGLPTHKMAIFCPKMAYNCPFWAKSCVFWGWVVSLRPPNPILQVPDSKKHVL